jgi:hypothetical protein
MKFQIKHIGKVEGEKLNFNDTNSFINTIKLLDGKEFELVIRQHKKYRERSEEQNAYWHAGICLPLSEENGDTPEFWHKYLKVKFLMGKMLGEEVDIDRVMESGRFDEIANLLTTTELTTAEFSKLTSDVRSWASLEMGMYLLTPDEYHQKIYFGN